MLLAALPLCPTALWSMHSVCPQGRLCARRRPPAGLYLGAFQPVLGLPCQLCPSQPRHHTYLLEPGREAHAERSPGTVGTGPLWSL